MISQILNLYDGISENWLQKIFIIYLDLVYTHPEEH